MPKDNNLLMFYFSTIGICNCKSDRINMNKNSPKIVIKSLPSYNAVTKKLDSSDFFIPIFLIENRRNYKSKYVNIKNKNNRQNKIYLHICASKYQHF